MSAPTRREAGFVALAGLVVAVAMAVRIGAPSLWWDELATLSAATRSVPELFAMARSVDLVHVPYYLLMHGWLSLVPHDEFWLRLPGALAVGATVPVVYGIGRMLSGRPVAIVAALVFVAVPRTSWTATEARSFALATLVAAATVLLFLVAIRSGRALILVVASVAGLMSVLLWIYSATVLVSVLALLPSVRGRRRRVGLTIAALAPIAVAAPFLVAVVGQRGQVGGTKPTGVQLPGFVLGEQWFLTGGGAIEVAFWLAVVGLGVVALARRHSARAARIRRGTLPLLVLWLLLPLVVVVAASRVFDHSLYQPRALAFTTPALAVLIAIVAVRAVGLRGAAVLGGILLLATVPSWAGVRAEDAKGVEWRRAADLAADAASGPTALVFVDSTDQGHVLEVPSVLVVGYSARLAGLDDVTLLADPAEGGGLWPVRAGIDRWAELLDGYDRVVVVRGTPDGAPETANEESTLRDEGFAPDSMRSAGDTTVEVWMR